MKRIVRYGNMSNIDVPAVFSASHRFIDILPEPDVEEISIPGRSGTLIISNDRYKNVLLTYNVGISANSPEELQGKALSLISWLRKGAFTYLRLEDSFAPEYYRLAQCKLSTNIENIMFQHGSTQIEFNCKPQVYLKTGEQMIEVKSGQSVYNWQQSNALPIIRVYGHGKFTIGDISITISDGSGSYVDIDCDLHLAYEGSVNKSRQIKLTEWPALKPGENAVSFDDTISKIEMIPRWYI